MCKLATKKVKVNTVVIKYTGFLASIGKEGMKSIIKGYSYSPG